MTTCNVAAVAVTHLQLILGERFTVGYFPIQPLIQNLNIIEQKSFQQQLKCKLLVTSEGGSF